MTTPSASPLDWTDLVAAGRATLVPQPPDTQPSQAAIRRAISTAYYAAFHALAGSNAEVLASATRGPTPGGTGGPLQEAVWMRAYRGLNHGYARAQLLQHRTLLPTDTRLFADIFCKLQDERTQADYNPAATFTLELAQTWLDNVETAAADFLQAPPEERAAVAVLTLIRAR